VHFVDSAEVVLVDIAGRAMIKKQSGVKRASSKIIKMAQEHAE